MLVGMNKASNILNSYIFLTKVPSDKDKKKHPRSKDVFLYINN